jgi:hypothetical protein
VDQTLEGHPVLAHLGPEPLSDAFNADYLQQKCAKKKTAIKPWLMDNKLVVGVGNIYASESLFSAGIHPDRLASSLSREECEQLVKVIKLVLLRSIEQGGTTLKDFLQSDGKPGYFAQELQVYGRKGEPPDLRHAGRRDQTCPAGDLLLPSVPEVVSGTGMFVGQVSGPAGAHLGPGAFVGQVSVAPSGIKTGTEPVWMAQRRSAAPAAWLMPQQMRYFSLFNSAWWTLAGRNEKRRPGGAPLPSPVRR